MSHFKPTPYQPSCWWHTFDTIHLFRVMFEVLYSRGKLLCLPPPQSGAVRHFPSCVHWQTRTQGPTRSRQSLFPRKYSNLRECGVRHRNPPLQSIKLISVKVRIPFPTFPTLHTFVSHLRFPFRSGHYLKSQMTSVGIRT